MVRANDSWRISENHENDESNESFVLKSDSDAEYEAKNSSSEDEDDLLADNSEDGLDTLRTEHNAPNEGILTPMIRKAIRRSIHRFSKDLSDDEKNLSDDKSKKENYIPDSDEESDLEQPILGSKSKKKLVIELDSSESSDEGYKPNIESAEDSSDELEAEVVPDFRDHRIKNETEQTQGKHTFIILDSSEEKENIFDNSPHSKFAMSIAVEESRNSTLDPLNAQTKALLMYQREQVEQKLAKTKMLLNRGNHHMLPDKGERLHTSRPNDEKELEVIKNTSKKLVTGDQSAGLLKVKEEEVKKTLFQKGSLEIDPTYLKPTTANIEKNLGKQAQETLYREQTLTVDRLKDLHGSLLAKPPEDQRAKDPRGLKVPLMPHQQYALTWLLWREQQNPPGGLLDLEHNGLASDDAGDLIKRIADLSMKDEDNEEDGEIGVDERVAEHLLTSDNPVFDVNRRSSKGIMDDFNSRNSKTNVLLLSLTAGGVGLNLVGANHLLLIDIHWNPQLECQAQDRIYRFGQKKNVFIYKYICTDTIEERIKALQEKKMAMTNDLLSGGGKVGSSKLSLDEMKTLFGL